MSKKVFILLSFTFITIYKLGAQCAMCKATVESNGNNSTVGVGLNNGILYLMAVPYILFFIVVAIFYYRWRQHKKQYPNVK